MGDFFAALSNPTVPFIRYALFAGLLASVSFGVMGTFVVVKRISYLAGAIAHSVLGGIGLAVFLRARFGWEWLEPIYGALLVAVLAAFLIGAVRIYAQEREDTVIGAMWAIGMSSGLLLIAKTPGYVDAMGYLFGNILIIGPSDLWWILGLDLLVLFFTVAYYRQLVATSFDEEHAALRGVNTRFFYFLILVLTALAIVLLTTIVGIVMVLTFMTLPAAVGSMLGKRIWTIMGFAVVYAAVFSTVGLAVSYATDLPTGSVIILLSGLGYLAAVALRVLGTRRRRARVELRT